ncbi:DUF6603 domain-containing protein [Streptomyces sp. SP18CS02]|uniref:DUF6603 domain-containing protein n=1 Tax=Streptomyces sp. SP18CS02 TaxID=3002531 RepID=UPI002E796F83|nr:DUF6603 domain-containing protein [Streptomyces sp. SP18CS02]MEE1754431.1 hypothetical protein [Streptomyces sp. SP18CS02]
MTVRLDDLRILLDQAPGGAVEIPVSVFADPEAAALVFPGGTVRIAGAVWDPRALSVGGQATITASSAPVEVVFTVDGERVTGTTAAVDLGEDRSLVLVDGTPEGAELPAGAWALADGRALRLVRRTPAPPAGPGRLDGLGRALPAIRHRDGAARDRTPRALVTEHGILTPRPGPRRRKGMRVLEAPSVRGWSPIGTPGGENGLSVDYYSPPLRIAGALTALPASPPYKTVVGGVLLVDTGAFNGSAMGAYVVPDGSGADPSLFAYGSLGSQVGFGPPLFQVRGISAGFGWNSRVRVPAADALGDFPFLVALDNPGEIGADDEEVDPLKVLGALIGGGNPWVRPQEGDLWFAAGLAFDCFETFRGRAMALVQTGSDLTISLLGVAGMQLPTKSSSKIARVEIGIEATLRPTAGELSIGAAFTEKTFLIDPNCKLRGGVGMKFWFGDHANAGDFAFMLGAIPAGRELPARYPRQQPAGLTWGVGSTVNITGNAYAAFTPKSLMAGGSLDVVFQSGMLRAWLSARVDALLEWNPFYFDVGMGIRVGVSATIKVWFVKIRISIEVGVSVRIWGPAVGGEATVHLWFISFTIGFGAGRRNQAPALDWGGFQGMLPPPENMVRTTPIAGYEGEGVPPTRGAVKPWLVSNGGCTFTADTQAPVSTVYLNQGGDTVEAATGDAVDILPMHARGKGSELRIWLTYNGKAGTLTPWGRAVLRGNVPNGLWGQKADAPNDGIIPDRILGIRLTSPPVDHGTDTGFIDEEAISFDPINPDGNQPLSVAEPATGPTPTRPGGVIAAIQDGIDTAATSDHRTALAQALKDLGADLGTLDGDLGAYARAAGTAFTAEPMLVAG